MNKKDWYYISKLMWAYAENNEKMNQRISRLLKELVIIGNKNIEVIIDDMGKYEQNATSDRPNDTDSTNNSDF